MTPTSSTRLLIAAAMLILFGLTHAGISLTRAQDSPDCVDPTDPTLIVPQPDHDLPTVGEPFTDPAFCTTLRRISDSSDSGGMTTQEYSQLQAFSADNVYILLLDYEGYHVRRVDDLRRVEGLDTSACNAARWYPPAPHTLIHFDSNDDTTLRVQLTQVESGATETIFTFPDPYERVIVNASSDELSDDGGWMGGIASRSDGAWVIFALDIANRSLGAQLVIGDLYADACEPDPEWGEVTPDWVGVSPQGRYLVVQWTRDGTTRCSGLETFDLRTGAFVGRVYDGHQHGDLGTRADGSEFFMTFELYHPSGEPSLGVRDLPGNAEVSEPAYVQILNWGTGEHISCQGPPGVCLITAGTLADNGWNPFEGEIFLQYLDGRVERLAHHRSTSCGYWVQPRASLSRDGRYAVFASDWGRALDCDDLGRGDAYLIELGD